jgi:hypothetical protein
MQERAFHMVTFLATVKNSLVSLGKPHTQALHSPHLSPHHLVVAAHLSSGLPKRLERRK